MGIPIVIASNGYGTLITEAANGLGLPVTVASNGYGLPVVIVASGGMPVVGSSGGAALSVAYIGTAQDLVGAATYTFAARPIGAADTNRRTVVVVCGIHNSGATPLAPAVNINGAAATTDGVALGVNTGSGSRSIVGIYSRATPVGTTATIDVAFSHVTFECVIWVYSITGAASSQLGSASVTPALGSGATSGNLNVNTAANGVVIAGTLYFDVVAAGFSAWTGVTSDNNTIVYTADRRSAASAGTVAATPRTITINYVEAIGASGDSFAATAVSYQP